MKLENIRSKLSDEDFESLKNILDASNTLVLATLDLKGKPYSTPLYYCSDCELSLFYFSSKESQHSNHIIKSNEISVGIYNQHHSVKDLKGLQIKGIAKIINEIGLKDKIKELYSAKFADIIKREFIDLELVSKDLYEICPYWIKLVDNSVKFGFKKEWKC
jgi:uncharacterized protein YhbP (UPF0306 family)